MRHIRWVGLVPSLLIVGVLGGLMAPLSSEAAPPTPPTLTFKIDGLVLSHTSGSFLNTASTTCSASDVNLGYNFCYAINTSTTATYSSAQVKVPAGTGTLQPVRQYKILNYTGTTARLRMSDKNGQDGFSLAGMVIAPVLTNWSTLANNTDEEHILTIEMTGHFDATTDPTSTPTANAAINLNNAQSYSVAMRTGGEFGANPVYPATNPAVNCTVNNNSSSASYNPDGKCDALRDNVTFTGKGTFSSANTDVNILRPAGSANNTVALSFTIKAPHSNPDIHWDGLDNTDMGQVTPTYPSFDCKNDYPAVGNDSTRCTPTITQTMAATTKGPDKLTILNGNEFFCARCNEPLSATDTRLLKFLEGASKLLKFLRNLPVVQNHPAILARVNLGITQLDLVLNASNQPTTVCPDNINSGQGEAIVARHMAAGQSIDLGITSTDGSAVGIPAPQTGTIVINKTIAAVTEFGFTIPGAFKAVQTFGFTGTGKEVTNFDITTAAAVGSHPFNSLTTGMGDERTIRETGFPPPFDIDGSASGITDEYWFTKTVSCVSALNIPPTNNSGPTAWTTSNGTPDLVLPLTVNRSGYVTVTNLAEGDTLTCTFENGIFEIEQD